MFTVFIATSIKMGLYLILSISLTFLNFSPKLATLFI